MLEFCLIKARKISCFSSYLVLLYLIPQLHNLYSDLPEKEIKHDFLSTRLNPSWYHQSKWNYTEEEFGWGFLNLLREQSQSNLEGKHGKIFIWKSTALPTAFLKHFDLSSLPIISCWLHLCLLHMFPFSFLQINHCRRTVFAHKYTYNIKILISPV